MFVESKVVIDVGSYMIRAGFSDQDEPKCINRSVIGTKNNKAFFGNEVCKYPKLDSIKKPFETGALNSITTNFDILTEIWEDTFKKINAVPSEKSVMLCHPCNYPKKDLQKTMEIMFETFNVPSYTSVDTATLALYSSGRTNGVVLESGNLYTSIVPIRSGIPIYDLIGKSKIAGNEITNYLSKLLMPQGFEFHTFRDMEELRVIKEKYCFVAKNESMNLTSNIICSLQERKAQLSSELYKCSELIFNPGCNGFQNGNICDILFDTINRIKGNDQIEYYSNIFLSGGNTMMEDFPKRIENEMTKRAPAGSSVKIIAPRERINAAWIGGRIVAELPRYKEFVITKDEFKDRGPSIIIWKNFYCLSHK